ncbi:hypothetical protein EYF80_000713 [Liparis tanakae]|uniref:Uncharacterized protein n=1 Tax=Liparis tanakae TaxID=230148 RepID=A0A4Z2JEZ5_9TELE|nr:hypothetical protein EYF80_000713 [Liparis tanakae]
MGSRPVVVLLSELLAVPLQQPLLGHMVKERQQKPPQSASPEEYTLPLFLLFPLHRHKEHVALVQTCYMSFLNFPPSFCALTCAGLHSFKETKRGEAAALASLLGPMELSGSRCCMAPGHLPWLSGLGHGTHRGHMLKCCRGSVG